MVARVYLRYHRAGFLPRHDLLLPSQGQTGGVILAQYGQFSSPQQPQPPPGVAMAQLPYAGPNGMPTSSFGLGMQLPPGWPPAGFLPGVMPPPGFPQYPGAMPMPGPPQQFPAGLLPPQAQLQQQMLGAGAAPSPGSPLPRQGGAPPGIQPTAFSFLPPPDGMMPGGVPPGFQISFAQQRQQQLGNPQPLQQQYGPPAGTLAQSPAVSRGPSRGASASGPLQGGATQQQPYQQSAMPLPQPIVSGHMSGVRTPQGSHHGAPHSASGRLQVSCHTVNLLAVQPASINTNGCQSTASL